MVNFGDLEAAFKRRVRLVSYIPTGQAFTAEALFDIRRRGN